MISPINPNITIFVGSQPVLLRGDDLDALFVSEFFRNLGGSVDRPEELKKYFSNYHFDGKRLMLKSKGSYSEQESGKEKMRLSWNVDLNLPVFHPVK
jgi:hypothetical protein